MFLEIFIKYTYLFTLKKLLLNNLVTLSKNLTLEIYLKQKNQRSDTGFTGILAKN